MSECGGQVEPDIQEGHVDMVRVSVLGEQVIAHDGTGVRARSSRAAELVAFLVAHVGSPRARRRIAGRLWPDSTQAQALTNLRRELHQLRQVLGAEPSLGVTPRIGAGVIARRRTCVHDR